MNTGNVYVGHNAQDSQFRHFLVVDLSRSCNISYVMPDKFTSNLYATFGKSSYEHSLIVAINLVRNEDALHGVKENGNVFHTIKRRKDNWIG